MSHDRRASSRIWRTTATPHTTKKRSSIRSCSCYLSLKCAVHLLSSACIFSLVFPVVVCNLWAKIIFTIALDKRSHSLFVLTVHRSNSSRCSNRMHMLLTSSALASSTHDRCSRSNSSTATSPFCGLSSCTVTWSPFPSRCVGAWVWLWVWVMRNLVKKTCFNASGRNLMLTRFEWSGAAGDAYEASDGHFHVASCTITRAQNENFTLQKETFSRGQKRESTEGTTYIMHRNTTVRHRPRQQVQTWRRQGSCFWRNAFLASDVCNLKCHGCFVCVHTMRLAFEIVKPVIFKYYALLCRLFSRTK